jgi:transcriptional regulator with XRE-family HTH domain
VDDVRLGSVFRTLRVRRGWRQEDLGQASGVSRGVISRLERGHLGSLSVATLRRVAAALEARVDLTARWRAGELDRLLDAGHAALVGAVIARLIGSGGWTAAPEVSFAIYGERGSIDVLAWHSTRRVLLVIEVKTELTDLQALLSTTDRKRRLALRIGAERGWAADRVGLWVVVGDTRTNRRRLAQHHGLLRAAYPDDGRRVAAWLRDPGQAIAAFSFLSYAHARGARPTSVRRVRRRQAGSGDR